LREDEIFKELNKRVGKDLIIAYSEVKELSGLSDKEFSEIYLEWLEWKISIYV